VIGDIIVKKRLINGIAPSIIIKLEKTSAGVFVDEEKL